MEIVGHNRYVTWQCPPIEAPPEYRKSWIDELVVNGEKWAQAQEGTKSMQKDIRLLLGLDQENSMKSNMLEPNIRTFVETISDLKLIATMGTQAEQFKRYAALQNKVLKHTYWESEFVFNTRKTLQYSMFGSGFTWLRFCRDKAGWGKAMNRFEALGPFEVLPEQLPHNNDIQGAYACTVVIPMPVWEAHARFPRFQEWLTPISRYDWKKYSTSGAVRLDYWDRTRFSQSWAWEDRYCEIRISYFNDLRINETGKNYQMGNPNASWGYTVPSYGDLIVTKDPFNGLPRSRRANEEDARMYPQLRWIITCPTCPVPLEDDTAPDWHGEIPVVQYDVNDYPWAARGFSAVRKVASLEKNRRARASEINEVLSVRKDPPTGYDFTSGVSRTQMEKLDLLRAQGIRIGLKGEPKKSVVSILPDGIEVDGEDWKAQEWYDAAIKASLGMADVSSLRDLKMNMSDNQMEKFITNLGPMAKGITMVLWRANSRLAQMLKYNNAQYYPVSELENMIGPEAMDIQTYDNDPTSLIPALLPGEHPDTKVSAFTKRQRAKWFLERLGVVSTPLQLLDISDMQEKMVYMFLFGKGAQIPQVTYMEKFGIHNYEALHEEWKQDQLKEALWKLDVQVAVAKHALELGIQPQEEGGPGQGKGGGRPNSNKKPPSGAVKGARDGNVRPVNKTS
jgi:hypothetical protein